MGPGLILAFLAGSVRAEIPVGLDAKGVDPMAAVENPELDVRDELGRPVRAENVLAELKAAQAVRAAQNSYTSRLPKARTVFQALELSKGLGAWIVSVAEALGRAVAVAAAPSPRPRLALIVWAALGLAAACLGERCSRPAPSLAHASRQSRIEVLRC